MQIYLPQKYTFSKMEMTRLYFLPAWATQYYFVNMLTNKIANK